jgi:hypothetical protein
MYGALLLSFAAHSHSAWEYVNQVYSTRLTAGQNWTIRSCIFVNCTFTGIWGGAINADGSQTGNLIGDCTIIRCKCTNSSGLGGAIAMNSVGRPTLRRICAVDCWAFQGPFLFLRREGNVSDISVLRCAPKDVNTINGGITVDGQYDGPPALFLETANFTQCYLVCDTCHTPFPDGSALLFRLSSSTTCTVKYTNFFYLEGRTSVRCSDYVVTLDYCNFVHNNNQCVVWSDESGDIRLTSCYFKANTGNYIDHLGTRGALKIADCSIDRTAANVGDYTDGGGNHFGADLFTTYVIWNFYTLNCPGIPSPSNPFSASSSFTSHFWLRRPARVLLYFNGFLFIASYS